MSEDPNKLIEPYLYGELAGEELEAFEEQYFTDDDLFEQIETREMRLIDRYVRREMSPEEKQRFENGYLVSAERRSKTAEAEMFHNELAKMNPAGKGFLAGLFEGISLKISVLQMASVATIVLIGVGILWTLWILQTNPQPVAETNVQGPVTPIDANVDPPINVPPAPDPNVGPGVEVPNGTPTEDKSPVNPDFRDIMPPGGTDPTFATPIRQEISETLSEGATGSVGSYKRIVIGEGVQTVRLTLVLPEGFSGDTYTIDVRNAAGSVVLSSDAAKPFGPNNQRLSIRTVPGAPFAAGRYVVTVKPSGRAESVRYGFEVVEEN
ncbi:MAG: hypothetical protein DWQ47_10055 [Acidobacteria bacterium]|nr:MAG: hypothetical protein DWQ32_12470 [Acidobacteriota bacterium]REJ98667.1 MAG: hypothetical protein DWQ38_15010 [Acidobacteriota bacterium]REK16677.1 MAG: hypothetical protein DWQ43_00315 [Acidobacteriota bacterium]REK42588.1 MAG: hypothetical protein DWQ47_10055 [Acidobacteriota bacterium]